MIRRGYLMLLTGLMAGLLLAGVLSRAYGSTGGASSIGRPERIDLVFLLTSEKEGWINAVKPLNLILYVTGSHETVNLMFSGSVKPDVWSPASSIWILYFDEKWRETHGNVSIVGDWYPVVLSPLVLVGWSDVIEKYNVRGFSDLYRLARSGVDFRYGHPDPLLSNGGVMALIMEFCEAANKTPDQLTIDDVRDPRVLEIVKTIESKAVYYGKSTGFFGAWAVDAGPQAITFFAVYENVALSYAAKARAKWGSV
jgi:hypothetical protein